ncbi:DUF885 domain-containing protein [Woodsholea maritima]|uniref:DUF885 domain-containing protein n=1 Tax=Woodsholea maritima TaxID=240237 RepID=UPI00037BB4C6|nr:DUF885 domain-containing protein [Woodsholea maritima]
MTLKLLLSASAGALLLACSPQNTNSAETSATSQPAAQSQEAVESVETQSESERLNAWFQAIFEEDLAESPELQTYLNMVSEPAAYGQWDDNSEAAFNADLEQTRERLAAMRSQIDYDALDETAKISYRFYEFVAEDAIRQGEFWDHNLIFTQFFGPHTSMPTTLIGLHQVNNMDQAEGYVSRLEGLGPKLRVYIDQADARAQNGILPPAFAYETIINTARGMITGAPFDDSETASPLLADFEGKLENLDASDELKADLRTRARQALETSVKPAYEYLIETMQRHEVMADGRNQGAWAMPRGEAYYQARLSNYTTGLDLSADQIHETGLAEVERIHGEMRDIMAQVGFEGTVQDFFAHLRESDEFYYPNTDEGRARYLSEATAKVDALMEAAPNYFATLPQAELEVRAVEPYRIETATGAFYESGAIDGSRPGAYYINLANMREVPVYQMETLAFHEGAPGHHFQLSIAQELENIPMFQKFTVYSAYAEGWALYSEWLGKDMGFFTDPYQDFGRLSYEVFRAARLVVDTGLHSKEWSQEQAITYMLENTPMTEGDITNEVRRYTVWPGQAVSYKVGMMTIQNLRTRAEEALGDDFDIREFHDVVLTNGSVPLSLLSDMVDDYIAEKQG